MMRVFLVVLPILMSAGMISAGLGFAPAYGQSEDFPATAATPCTVAPGAALISSISPPGDRDWCRFTMEAGRNHAFQVQISGQAGQELTLASADVRIFTADGDRLAPAGQFANEFVNFIAPAGSDAFLEVRGTNSVFDQGTYRIVMRARDDIRSDTQTTATLAGGSTIDGNLEGEGDADWFRVELEAGKRNYFRVLTQAQDQNLTLPGNTSADIELRDANGIFLFDESNQTPELSFVSTTSGTFYVAVVSNPQVAGRGTYRLLSAGDDAGESVASAGDILPGTSLRGEVEAASDIDLFGFEAGANERYFALIQGSGVDDLTNTNICLTVRRPNGQEATFQCSGGSSAETIAWTTDEPGRWFIGAFSSLFATGTYQLRLSGRDDYPNTLATTARADPFFPANGVIEGEGDVDWFKTDLVAGSPVTVRIKQLASGQGTLNAAHLIVTGPTGAILAQDLGGGGEPNVTFTPPTSGEHVVRVDAFCNIGVGCDVGTYRVEVTQGVRPATTTTIAAATLPNARSIQLGSGATFFGTILNTGSQTARRCGVAPSATTPSRFTFRRTNAQNVAVGDPNTRFDIPAGQAGQFVLGLDPSSAYLGAPLTFDFQCENTDAAPIVPDVNGFTLSAAETPVPDVIMVAATLAPNDGVARIPGVSGTGFFTTAAINIGAPATVVFEPRATTLTGLAPIVCETNPTTGACLAPPSGSVTRQMNANDVAFFSVFFAGSGQQIPFDPANRRIRFVARDPGQNGTVRGSTSVAVQTQ